MSRSRSARTHEGGFAIVSVRLARSATADTIPAFPVRIVREIARDQAADDRSGNRRTRLGRRPCRVGSPHHQTVRHRRARPNRARCLAGTGRAASVDRARLDPHDRDPDGDQPRRSQIPRARSGHANLPLSLDHHPNAGIDGHDRPDGGGSRPRRRPGESAGVLPLRRRPPPLEPRPRGLPDPAQGRLGRFRLARRLASALVATSKRWRGPSPHRRVRREVRSGSTRRGPRP